MFRYSSTFFARPRTRPLKIVKPPRVSTYSKYQCFVVEAHKRKEIKAIKSFEERGMVLGHIWRNMSEAEKEPYAVLSKNSKAISASQRRSGLVKKDGWKQFVIQNYSQVRYYPVRERLRLLAKQWRAYQKRKLEQQQQQRK